MKVFWDILIYATVFLFGVFFGTWAFAGQRIDNLNYDLPPSEGPGIIYIACATSGAVENALDHLEDFKQLYGLTGQMPPYCVYFEGGRPLPDNHWIDYLYFSDENKLYGVIAAMVLTSDEEEVMIWAWIDEEIMVKKDNKEGTF